MLLLGDLPHEERSGLAVRLLGGCMSAATTMWTGRHVLPRVSSCSLAARRVEQIVLARVVVGSIHTPVVPGEIQTRSWRR
jgi:hypothetical protein